MSEQKKEMLDFIDNIFMNYSIDEQFEYAEKMKQALRSLVENIVVSREFVEKYARAITGDGWMGNMQFETINTAVRLTKMLAELGHEIEGKEESGE